MTPNPFKTALPNGVELQIRNRSGRVAWKRSSHGINEDHLTTPPTDTCLGITSVVIRKDCLKLDSPFESGLCFNYLPQRTFNLNRCRHQSVTVLQRPAVILHVSNFDSMWFKRLRKLKHCIEPIQILPMDNDVNRER